MEKIETQQKGKPGRPRKALEERRIDLVGALLTPSERQAFDEYCSRSNVKASDLLRGYIKSLCLN